MLPEPVDGDARPRMAAYFTEQTSALCLDVGLIKHRSLRRRPAPPPEPEPAPAAEPAPAPPAPATKHPTKRPASPFARVARRARRIVSG